MVLLNHAIQIINPANIKSHAIREWKEQRMDNLKDMLVKEQERLEQILHKTEKRLLKNLMIKKFRSWPAKGFLKSKKLPGIMIIMR